MKYQLILIVLLLSIGMVSAGKIYITEFNYPTDFTFSSDKINNIQYFFDNNLGTYANFYPPESKFYINYTVPKETKSAVWTINSIYVSSYNVTECIIDNVIQIYVVVNGTGPYTYIYCNNGTNKLIKKTMSTYLFYDEHLNISIGKVDSCPVEVCNVTCPTCQVCENNTCQACEVCQPQICPIQNLTCPVCIQNSTGDYQKGFEDGKSYQKGIDLINEVKFWGKLISLLNERINNL